MSPYQAYVNQAGQWKLLGRPAPLSGGWIYGPQNSYQPGATTSGVPAGTTLTTYPSTGGPFGPIVQDSYAHTEVLRITQANAVLDGWLFPCAIQNKTSSPVLIRRSKIIGGPSAPLLSDGVTPASLFLVDNTAPGIGPIVVEDSEICGTNSPSVGWNGFGGRFATLRRCNIWGTTDLVRINSAHGDLNMALDVLGCYLHDLVYWLHDPQQGGGPSHSDGIQIEAVPTGAMTGVNVEGNFINAYFHPTLGDSASAPRPQSNSATQFNPRSGYFGPMTFQHNWLRGGGATMNLAQGSIANGPNAENYDRVKIINNIFIPSSALAGTSDPAHAAVICGTKVRNLNGNDFVTGNSWSDGTTFALSNGGAW